MSKDLSNSAAIIARPIQEACEILRAARSRHGHALRASRRRGVELLRLAFTAAEEMLSAEAVPMPPIRNNSTEWRWRDSGHGVRLINDREHTEGRDHFEEDGTEVWWMNDNHLAIVERTEHTYRAWHQGEHDPSHDYLCSLRRIGLREASRRWGVEVLYEALHSALTAAAARHNTAAAAEIDRAEKFSSELGCGCG